MAGASVSSKTVLIADDTAFVRDRFRVVLENAGHKAILVASTAELLACLGSGEGSWIFCCGGIEAGGCTGARGAA
jgi:CheY-like chemotaxis protein